MGIIIKQSFKASLFSYLGIFIGAANNLFLFPQFIGSEGIGIINVISAAASLFLPVLQLGFNTSLIKYFPVFKEKPYFTTFITYAFIIPLLALLGFILLWPLTEQVFEWLFKAKANLVFENIEWVLPLTAILVFFGLFESLAKANYKIVFPTLVRNVIWRLSMTFGVALVGFKFLAMNQLVIVLVWSWFLSLIILLIYTISLGGFKLGWKSGFLKDKETKSFNSFSAYVILLGVSGVLIQKIDQLMVGAYLGESPAGVFSTAMYFATLIEIPKRSVIGIIQPVLVNAFKNDDMDKVDEMYKKSSLNLFLIGGVIFLLIWINVQDIFQIIPRSKEFSAGIYVVLFYGLARVIDMGMGCNNEIIVFSKFYKVNLPMQFLLVGIVMLTNAIFIPKFDIAGAALATTISVLTYNLLRFVYLYWKLRIIPFSEKSLYTLIVLVSFWLIAEAVPFEFSSFDKIKMNNVLNIIIRSTVIGLPMILIFYFLRISSVINNAFDDLIKKLK